MNILKHTYLRIGLLASSMAGGLFSSSSESSAGPMIINYPFYHTSGLVSDYDDGAGPGVIFNDGVTEVDSHNHPADAAIANPNSPSPSYSADIPAASLRQFTTGSGSIQVANGVSIQSTGTGFVSNVDVINWSGLTIEAWIKNDGVNAWTDEMTIMSLGGVFDLKIMNGGQISLQDGWDGHAISHPIDGNSWTHVAGVLTATVNPGVINMTLFVNGAQVATSYWYNPVPFLNRNVGIGAGWGLDESGWRPAPNGFSGLIYEPRISLGALTPAEFMFVAAPTMPTLTDVKIVNGTDIQFTLSGTGSGTFVVEASQSLGQLDAWLPVQTLTGSLPVTFTDSNVVGTYPKRFYRVAVAP